MILLSSSCNKEPIEEDYRVNYTGYFNFITIEQGISMCYDSSSACIDGWEIVNTDTSYITTEVVLADTNRLKIKFGEGIIGENDNDSLIAQTINPILMADGELSLPEYPIGGHNKFSGNYFGFDTIRMDFQFGFGIGSYKKFEVIGVRE
jgi:hypothetical protein